MKKGETCVRAGGVLLIGLLLAACTSTPEQPPFVPPAWSATTRHYAGTILAGPRPAATQGTFELVTVQVTALERLAGEILTPVSHEARLIASRGGRATFATTPRLGRQGPTCRAY